MYASREVRARGFLLESIKRTKTEASLAILKSELCYSSLYAQICFDFDSNIGMDDVSEQ